MNYYVYLLIHLESKEFYYGSRVCKCTPEEDRSYLGSMVTWKPDKTKLIKTILKSDFIDRAEALKYEASIIKENINNPLNRNYHIPTIGFSTTGRVVVRDKKNNIFSVSCNDPKYLSGEYTHINKNVVVVKDKTGKVFRMLESDPRYLTGDFTTIFRNTFLVKDKKGVITWVSKHDERYLSGELVALSKGMVTVKDLEGETSRISTSDPNYLSGKLVSLSRGMVTVRDREGNCFNISQDDPRYLSGEVVSNMKGRVSVKDKYGNNLKVSIDDPRYTSGELIHICTNKARTEETKQKLRESRTGRFNGEQSPRYGTVWIFNKELKETKVINKDMLNSYLESGWTKGRCMKF